MPNVDATGGTSAHRSSERPSQWHGGAATKDGTPPPPVLLSYGTVCGKFSFRRDQRWGYLPSPLWCSVRPCRSTCTIWSPSQRPPLGRTPATMWPHGSCTLPACKHTGIHASIPHTNQAPAHAQTPPRSKGSGIECERKNRGVRGHLVYPNEPRGGKLGVQSQL